MKKRKLNKNRIYSVGLMLLGLISIPIVWDITPCLLLFVIGLPLFFTKENMIDSRGGENLNNKVKEIPVEERKKCG